MDTIEEEEWREIPGHEGKYEVSNMGRIRSWHPKADRGVDFPYYLKIQKDPAGYCRVYVAGKHRYMHRMVALAWLGEPPEGYHVHHRNKVRDDNRHSNLEYLSREDNLKLRDFSLKKKIRCPHCDGELW